MDDDDGNKDGKVECCGVDVDSHLNEQGQICGIGSAACTSLSSEKPEAEMSGVFTDVVL